MIDKALRCERKNPQYAYFAPNYGQAKRVAWDYLKEYLHVIPGFEANEAELRVDIPRPHLGDRIRFMLLGADSPGSIRGIYLDGAILDEYAEMYPAAWTQVIRPALSDRIGWAVFIGTPKGMNHFHDVYQLGLKTPGWFTAMYKASETNIIDPNELAAARREMSEEEFNQEFECSFAAAMVGAYFGKQMEEAENQGRITKVLADPNVYVNTWWDLGLDDATAIWFTQPSGMNYRVLKYMEASDVDLPTWVRQVKNLPYNYDRHYLPHDAMQRDFGTNKTRAQIMENLGLRPLEVQPKFRKEDQINAARTMIQKCYFDREGCEKGINALKNYQRKWDEKNKSFAAKPLHNWASHGADAFMGFGMGQREMRMDYKKLQSHAITDYDPFAY